MSFVMLALLGAWRREACILTISLAAARGHNGTVEAIRIAVLDLRICSGKNGPVTMFHHPACSVADIRRAAAQLLTLVSRRSTMLSVLVANISESPE